MAMRQEQNHRGQAAAQDGRGPGHFTMKAASQRAPWRDVRLAAPWTDEREQPAEGFGQAADEQRDRHPEEQDADRYKQNDAARGRK